LSDALGSCTRRWQTIGKREKRVSEGGIVGKFAEAIRSGAALSAWVGFNDVFVAEALARDAFDAVTLDMQHGGIDFAGAGRAIQAVAAAGKPTIVRVPVGDFATASRLADFGAAAVIAPMINSAGDARRFADFLKFPPLGQRSWGPRSALSLSGLAPADYLKAANRFTLALAMIETREALAAVGDILDVESVDGVFVGPSDLSIGLSDGAGVDPHGAAVDAALKTIVAAAQARGKFVGLWCADGARAAYALSLGVRFCTVSSDQMLMRAAAKAELKAARG
jgi:4-hydroxy-2-oxoheptanedioate aldolase